MTKPKKHFLLGREDVKDKESIRKAARKLAEALIAERERVLADKDEASREPRNFQEFKRQQARKREEERRKRDGKAREDEP